MPCHFFLFSFFCFSYSQRLAGRSPFSSYPATRMNNFHARMNKITIMSSSRQREGAAKAPMRQSSCGEMVRQMLSLPRSLIGGVSKAMANQIGFNNSNGSKTSGSARRDQNNHYHHHPVVNNVAEEWAFLASFEQNYGLQHPFFYACRFMEALRMAELENKLLFIYLHSPDHPFTASFCNTTLISELVIQLLDANFISWGALSSREEGLQMATALQVDTFPFCAVVAPAPGFSIAVLEKIIGPVSPVELVEILQRTIEEHGLAFSASIAREEEKRRADRQLREEQDAAYLASLQIDKERERGKEVSIEEPTVKRATEAGNKANKEKVIKQSHHTTKPQGSKVKEGRNVTPRTETWTNGNESKVTKILIRLPNGEKTEQTFLSRSTIHAIYKYIDSLRLPGIASYRLISGFPRKVYGHEQMQMTLKDAGLHPRASLFLELIN